MRVVGVPLAIFIGIWLLLIACVDPEDITQFGTVNVIVVDGALTNLAEPQIIRLNRSKADRLTGRFGTVPLTKAIVRVIVDSIQVIDAHETVDGSYQLPSDFKGQIGHSYQLRFTLSDGTSYVSTQQVMQPVPTIGDITSHFNPTALPARFDDGTYNAYRGAHELFINWQDPADQHNYYRWDWVLWERQEWCRTCIQSEYAQYQIISGQPFGGCYMSNNKLYEDCYAPPEIANPSYNFGGKDTYFVYDYNCRTQCWEILYSYAINVFDDTYSNGGFVTNRKIAQIPYYQPSGCLVEIRQSALTKNAYGYFKLLQDQTQNTGGVADTPPTALAGNVHNTANGRELVAGYFTASAVSATRYWVDRKDATGLSPGLFDALYSRSPIPEPRIPVFCIAAPPSRPPTALCVSSDHRTPYKPEGWKD